jgi:uncharacterized membrane protein
VVQPPQVRRLEQELPVVTPPAVPAHPVVHLVVELVVARPVDHQVVAQVARPAVEALVAHLVAQLAVAMAATAEKAMADQFPTSIRITKSTNCYAVVEAIAGGFGDVDSGPGSTSRP